MASAPSTRDLTEQLRSAGAWLYLAADDLDRGDLAQATKKAALGMCMSRLLPVEIRDLSVNRKKSMLDAKGRRSMCR